jgi:hypothetical protein
MEAAKDMNYASRQSEQVGKSWLLSRMICISSAQMNDDKV